MADYVVKLNGQDNLSPTLNSVKQALGGISSTATGLDKIQERFNKIQNSSAPLQRKLKDIKNLMAQLNLSGDSNSPIYNQMAQAAGNYADAIADARDATSRFASDTMALDAGIQALQGIAAAGSIATGVMGLFGTKNEEVERAILKVQSAIAILNGVQSISNILNKDSALMQKLKQIRIVATTAATTGETSAIAANTVAQTVNTGANKKSTIAQNAWNMAKAISKALLGDFTGLLIVGAGALATYAIATSDSTDKVESQEKAVSLASKAIKDYNNKVGSEVGSVVGKFRTLQNQWKELKTTAEKTQFIKDNQTAFNELGIAINGVIDAEKAFVQNSDKVINALIKIARAKAAVESTNSMWQDFYADDRLTRRYTADATISNINQLSNDKDKAAAKKALKPYMSEKTYKEFEKTGAIPEQYRNWVKKAVNDEREAEMKAEKARIEKDSEARIKEANALTKQANDDLDGLGINGKGKSKNTPKSKTVTPKPDKDKDKVKTQLEQYREIESKAKQIQEEFNVGLIDEEKAKLAIENVNKELVDKFGENAKPFKLEVKPTIAEGSLQAVERDIKNIKDEIVNINPELDPEKFAELKSKLGELLDLKEEMEKSISFEVKPTISEPETKFKQGSLEDKRQSYSNAMSMIDQVKSDFANKLIDKDQAESQIKSIVEQLQALIPDLKINLTVNDDGTITTAEENLEKYKEKMGQVGETVGQFGSVFSSLGGAIEGTGGEILNFAGNAINAIGQLIPQIITLITAKEAEAMASGTASGAALPFPANLAAIAGIIATIAGVFASLPKFAEGGIVGGGSMSGDHLLARVNSGEMILNGRQQDNLFRAIDENRFGSNGGGQVEFKIDGTVIKGVLNNINRKIAKQS